MDLFKHLSSASWPWLRFPIIVSNQELTQEVNKDIMYSLLSLPSELVSTPWDLSEGGAVALCGRWWVWLMRRICVYLVPQWCLTLCDPMDCSPPGTFYHRIFQARNWSGLPFPAPGEPSNSGIKPMSPALAGRFFTTEPSGNGHKTGFKS